MCSAQREFEVVAWGATGFTGRLVAEHLSQHYGAQRPLRWAIGGRDRAKLERLADDLTASSGSLPILVGDSHDRASLEALVRRTSVVCSTVGPYAKHGSELVAACVDHGTHYCDLSGELQWIRAMLDRHQARAEETGARIVHCCGFDSIPSDLGCFFLQHHVRAEHDTVCKQVKLRVLKMRGGFSGGTIASLLNLIDESRSDPQVRRIVRDPYALNPADARDGLDGPDNRSVRWDSELESWTAPFVMAPINTRVVRRTNAVLGYPYGRDFRYDEAVMTGRGTRGWMKAQSLDKGLKLLLTAAAARPTRHVLQKWFFPGVGEGPSESQRAEGSFALRLIGKPADAATDRWSLTVTGNADPGYGSTARMLAESAVCLVQDAEQLAVAGGFWTPASCFGMTLLPRLEARAGMRFAIR